MTNTNQHFVAQLNKVEKRWEVIALTRTGDEASHIMEWESRFSGWEGEFVCSKWHIERYHFDQDIVNTREQQRYDNRYPKLPKVNVTTDHVHNANESVGFENDDGYEDAELCAAIATYASDPVFNPITVGMVAIDFVRGWDKRKEGTS